MIGNKIAVKISKIPPQKNTDSGANEEETLRERHISPEKRQEIINYLKLIQLYNIIIMKYQKVIKLLDDTTNQTSKFRTKNWVEMNDESRVMYNVINLKLQ